MGIVFDIWTERSGGLDLDDLQREHREPAEASRDNDREDANDDEERGDNRVADGEGAAPDEESKTPIASRMFAPCDAANPGESPI